MKRESLRLYAVTPCGCGVREVEEVLEGGVTFLQVREKGLGREAFLEKARRVREVCPFGVVYVVNDDVEVALGSGADGAHIGQGDGSIEGARARLGEGRILGVSVGTVEEALEAERMGADYVGVGAMFPTQTKGDAEAISMDTLHAICASVQIPVVAIGGIGEGNVGAFAGSGVSGVAVVSALFGVEDVLGATRRMDVLTREMVGVEREGRRGALVDMDGTVLDSMGVWEAMDAEITERYGVKDREVVLEHLKTVLSLREGAVYLHEVCGVGASVEALCEEFTSMLSMYYAERLELFPGVKESLERMRAEGVRMALVTATAEPLARAALRRTGVEGLFDVFAFEVDKRTPSGLYGVLDALGVGLREAIVYDDSEAVRAMASKAGFVVRERV